MCRSGVSPKYPSARKRSGALNAPGDLGAKAHERRVPANSRELVDRLALHIAHEAESALGDHLAGRAVARIAVARDYRLDPSAIRQLAQEEDVVEALLALFP